MALFVEQAPLMMTVQDLGRFGFLRYGLPESGPMDWWAFRVANRLVGNPSNSACLEIGFSNAALRVERDVLLAACGAGYHLYLNGRQMPLWTSFWVREDDRLSFRKISGGNWVYLAIAGGIRSQKWMGSRSVYAKAGIGRLLNKGDKLPIAEDEHQSRWDAGFLCPESNRPAYRCDIKVGVIPGPQYERFTTEAQIAFWRQKFLVTSRSDRMGYRLQGPTLTHREGADIVSQGMVVGEVQVPSDGQPIVMMPDHPTTGGYTSIGTVCWVDLPLIAQAQPGVSKISFVKTNPEEARNKLSMAYKDIDKIERPQEDEWTNL